MGGALVSSKLFVEVQATCNFLSQGCVSSASMRRHSLRQLLLYVTDQPVRYC